ncbi:hypothetical protein SCP_0313530 [Sparassis crispa]|uniref:Uncharacterized protein n=1 Tax=Sparassis crispa TaxID=139825 RepID=A0A401GHE0_9APHY|nr:hypothetical protein SCP_0313530 [Sparassis crispa]GBE81624.1 hypothetical protein SCP_0313530 [Sparassis crispa]
MSEYETKNSQSDLNRPEDTQHTILPTVQDLWTTEEHEKMDRAVLEKVRDIAPPCKILDDYKDAAQLLLQIIEPCKDVMKYSLIDHHYNLEAVCDSCPELRVVLAEALEKTTFAHIRCLEIVRNDARFPSFLSAEYPVYSRVVIWHGSTRGSSDSLLNSLAREHVVVPLSLRDSGRDISPSDRAVYKWFNEDQDDPDDMTVRFTAFLAALFEKVAHILEHPEEDIIDRIAKEKSLQQSVRQEAFQHLPRTLAGKLHLFMTIGRRKDRRQGKLRREFYDQVLQRAIELYRYVTSGGTAEKACVPEIMTNQPSHSPADKLAAFLQSSAQHAVSLVVPPRSTASKSPSERLFLVVENAHTLVTRLHINAEHHPNNGEEWTRFSCLRRAFRALHGLPIWCICAGFAKAAILWNAMDDQFKDHQGSGCRVVFGVLQFRERD